MYGMNKDYTWYRIIDNGYDKRVKKRGVEIKGRIQKQLHYAANYEVTGTRGVTSAYLMTQDDLDYHIGDMLYDKYTQLNYAVIGVNKQRNIYTDNLLYVKLTLTTAGTN